MPLSASTPLGIGAGPRRGRGVDGVGGDDAGARRACRRRRSARPRLRRRAVPLLPGRLLRIDRAARGQPRLRPLAAPRRRSRAALRRPVPVARPARGGRAHLRPAARRAGAPLGARSRTLLSRPHRLPARLLRRRRCGNLGPIAAAAAGQARTRAPAARRQRADGTRPLRRGGDPARERGPTRAAGPATPASTSASRWCAPATLARGAAAARAGRHRCSRANEEQASLRDRANLALGFALLQQQRRRRAGGGR